MSCLRGTMNLRLSIAGFLSTFSPPFLQLFSTFLHRLFEWSLISLLSVVCCSFPGLPFLQAQIEYAATDAWAAREVPISAPVENTSEGPRW